MAGTLTTTQPQRFANSGISRHVIGWTSDASGNVTGDTPTIQGTLLRVVFNPGATAPTDNYDVTLTDPAGIDVLAGQGTDLDTATSTDVAPLMPATDGTTTTAVPRVLNDVLSLSISNAGNAKTGEIILYVRG